MRATPIRWFLVAAILLLGSTTLAKEKKRTTPAVSELVVGDGCALRVERHGVRKQFRGELVKITDRWIVLRSSSAAPNHDASKIPLLGSMLHSPPKEHRDEYLWIPREAAT